MVMNDDVLNNNCHNMSFTVSHIETIFRYTKEHNKIIYDDVQY